MNHLSISEVRADAVFVSSLQQSDQPSTRQVRQAVAAAVRQFGGRGCLGRVAAEFGEHPELAVARMRWALRLAGGAFGQPGSGEPGPGEPRPGESAGLTGPAGAARSACCRPHAA